MAFDSTGRYVGTHKAYDHLGNMIPDVEECEGIRPSFPFKPASWLPVVFWDKHFEQWDVIMPGKLVTLDPDGRVIPAHLGLTSASITYSTNDVTAGTVDIRTGEALLSTATGTVTLSTVDGSTAHFMGRQGVSFADSTAKYPIGVAPYAYLQWAGDAGEFDDGSNPAGLKENNYQMQHQVAVLCDFVIKLPLIPGQVASESLPMNWTSSTITFGTSSFQTLTYVRTTTRYAAAGFKPVAATDTVIALALANYPVAKNTTRTPITSTITGLLLNEVSSTAAVNVAGDFCVDYEMGVIFLYAPTGTELPAVDAADTITYFHYATAPGVYSVFACVLSTTSELFPGDFLTCGADSNFVRSAMSASTVQGSIVGQVLGFKSYPQGGLEYVRTAFNPALRTNSSGAMSNATLATSAVGLGQMDQMPGSANAGYPDALHYAGGADKMVIINLIGR